MKDHNPVTKPRIVAVAVMLLVPSLALAAGSLSGRHSGGAWMASAHQPIALARPGPRAVVPQAHAAATPVPAATMPQPVPQPLAGAVPPASRRAGHGAGGTPVLPASVLVLIGFAVVLAPSLLVWRRLHGPRPDRASTAACKGIELGSRKRRASAAHPYGPRRLNVSAKYCMRAALVMLLMLSLAGCGSSAGSQPAQSPMAYLNGALNWMQAHSAFSDRVSWPRLRRQVLTMVHHPHSTADTYPAIIFAVQQLRDGNAFFLTPQEVENQQDQGFSALYPERMVDDVEPGSSAARAGLRVGDVITRLNGKPPAEFESMRLLDIPAGPRFDLIVRRQGQANPVRVVFNRAQTRGCGAATRGRSFQAGQRAVGYIDLPTSTDPQTYISCAQQALRSVDRHAPCGWIVDLRHTSLGDIWTYLAALGPILGNGQVGAFVYPDGRRESWVYRDGVVRWNGKERDDGRVAGAVYRVKHPAAPVAVLTSRATLGAGELTAVALRGRAATRSFGVPTQGFPTLELNTALSDGAMLLMSGAFSFDRTGRIYRTSIVPDTEARTDWTHFGAAQDPPVHAALSWLQDRPECAAQ